MSEVSKCRLTRAVIERIAVEIYKINYKTGPLWSDAPEDTQNKYRLRVREFADVLYNAGCEIRELEQAAGGSAAGSEK